jgi:hypothetical protein
MKKYSWHYMCKKMGEMRRKITDDMNKFVEIASNVFGRKKKLKLST